MHRRAKLIHHAIRIAAYNTTRSLARAIVTDTGHAREAHTLIRTALAGSGDIIPDHRGWGGNFNLVVAADGTFVIRPSRAKLWAIIC